jgi:hypothetical protein
MFPDQGAAQVICMFIVSHDVSIIQQTGISAG